MRLRVTHAQLTMKLLRLSEMMGMTLQLSHIAAGWRVENATGSRDISPRLSAKEMAAWIEAGIDVLGAMPTGRERDNDGQD